MSEQQHNEENERPVSTEQPVSTEPVSTEPVSTEPLTAEPESTEQPVGPKPPRKPGRKAVALIAGGLGLAVLAGGGFWASERMDQADRSAPTRYWVPEGPKPTVSAPALPIVPVNDLTAKLLPFPDGYGPGPDIHLEGNDFYVSGERALQTFKDAKTGLSGDHRAARDKMLTDLKLKGLAGRSYADGKRQWVAEVHLTQADGKALAGFSEFGKKLLELTGDEGEAPKVDGFPEAKCAQQTLGEDELKAEDKIDTVECVSLEGDVLVSFRMYGAKPFSAKDATALFTSQLKHLKSPGESV
ncbi:hypothetical protein [Streptomyces sp. NPDC058401]|uniref:hypothetical protein n=1 Tax=Streptomyces sp. NPDC058401 TaxID=3346480 RepID=UPI003666B5D8